MDAPLRAGIAIYNAGGFHEAHDAWEDHWLDLQAGTDDEQFLHGLIQFTAAVHHGYEGNWAGVQGLAESALEYLDDLPESYRGVQLDDVRRYLAALGEDPEYIERVAPPKLRYEGRALSPDDLDFDGVAIAAEVLAEEGDTYDEAVVEDAVDYAREAVEMSESNRFVALVFDFVTERAHRGVVYQRLSDHVRRRRGETEDVDGLFD